MGCRVLLPVTACNTGRWRGFSGPACVLAAFAVVLCLLGQPALVQATNGIEVIGFGARSLSMGGVSIGVADGAASLIRNPAGISFVDRRQLDVGLEVMVPDLHFQNGANDAYGSRAGHESFYGVYPLPMIAYAQKIQSLPSVTWGVGLFVPGGIGSDYELEHPLWVSGADFHSQLIFSKLAVGAAWRVHDRVSLGLAVTGGFGWMDLWQPFATSPDFAKGSTAGAPAAIMGPTYGSVFERMGYDEVTCMFTMRQALAFGVGANVGVLWDVTDWLRVGVSYISPMHLHWHASGTMDMTAQFNQAASRFGMPAGLAYRAFGLSQPAGMRAHPDVDFVMDWPQQAGIGFSVRPVARMLLATDFRWINWSATMDELSMHMSGFANPNFVKMVGSDECVRSVPMLWKDQYVVSVGGSYDAGGGYTVRLGYNYGRNPVPAETAMPTFPAITEHHITVGAGRRWPTFDVNVSFEYAFRNTLRTTESIVADFYDDSENQLQIFGFSFTVGWWGRTAGSWRRTEPGRGTMSEEIKIDALGMKCPRPVIELAKARRQAEPGATIVITADDLAFESDVRAWCETTGNALENLSKEGNLVIATIRISED